MAELPTGAGGPEEQSPGHVSPTGQSLEEAADPQGKTMDDTDWYIWLLEKNLAAERELHKATEVAWREEVEQKTSLQTTLQDAEVALQDQEMQRTITQALQGELESTCNQFRSATHSYQDKIATLDQTCAEAQQKSKVLQKQWDDYKKECDKVKIEIAALESTNKSHQETIDAYREQLEEADKAADMAVEKAANKILQEKIMALATQAVALVAKATLLPPPLLKSPTKIWSKAELGAEDASAEDHPFSAGDPTSVIHGKPLHVQGGGDKPLLGAHVDPPATRSMGTQTQKEPNPPPQLAMPMVPKGHAQCHTELEHQGATTAPGFVVHSKHVAATTLHHQNTQQPGSRPPPLLLLLLLPLIRGQWLLMSKLLVGLILGIPTLPQRKLHREIPLNATFLPSPNVPPMISTLCPCLTQVGITHHLYPG